MARYRKIIGTGGVGAGIMYRLSGNHDLGRNESRAATRLDQKDRCKLHIILHYVARLLREWRVPAEVIPIGAVGDDDVGKLLLRELEAEGMRLDYVKVMKGTRTLFGICYLFPDDSGGNLAEEKSASSRVGPDQIRAVEDELGGQGDSCLVLGAPEVPLESRAALIEMGKSHGAFTAAAFVSEELGKPEVLHTLKFVDLLAINIDEAAMLAGLSPRKEATKIIQACVKKLRGINPLIKLSLTIGKEGSYAFEEGKEAYLPALEVKVINTAGAGDAGLAGYILGLAIGLPFIGRDEWSCFRLSRLLSAMSVQSADTINATIGADSIRIFTQEHREPVLPPCLRDPHN